MSGSLYLLPVSLGEEVLWPLPESVKTKISALNTFIVERAKTARRFIKSIDPKRNISSITILELDKHQPESHIDEYLQVVLDGVDVGVMSEAGCPGVADPGALVVKRAHQLGIKVVPMVGPSSILLALMASGMNGQNFAFKGYLSPKKPQLVKDLKQLERWAKQNRQTQIFIETPYRNQKMVEEVIRTLDANTLFGIAMDLTLSSEYIKVDRISGWKKQQLPVLQNRPAVFLIGSEN